MLQQPTERSDAPRAESPAEPPPLLERLRNYPDFATLIERNRRRSNGLPLESRPEIDVPVLSEIKLPIASFRSDWDEFDKTLKAVTGRYVSYDSADNAQMLRVWEKISTGCRTMPGGTMLLAMLANPPTDAAGVGAQREALEALRPGRPFRAEVDALFKRLEKEDLWGRNQVDCATDLINHESRSPGIAPESFLHGLRLMWQTSRKHALFYAESRNALKGIIEGCGALPESGSPLLQKIVGEIGALKNDPAFDLLTKTIYPNKDTVGTKPSSRWFGWVLGHRLGKFDLQGKGSLAFVLLSARLPLAKAAIDAGEQQSALYDKLSSLPRGEVIAPLVATLPLMLAPLLSVGWITHRLEVFGRKILPAFRDAVGASPLSGAYSRLGLLDAFCALADLREQSLSRGWHDPTIIDSPRYFASFSKMRNPFLELNEPGSTVPNDFELKARSIVSLSGPNSGGKTTLGLSLFWCTVLGQLGLPVPCESATFSSTDHAFYQGPQFSGLNDEGRLGFELEKMHDVLNKAGPKSLVVVDEMTGATSMNSGRRISARILWGLSKFDPGIILITHDFNYARRLERIGLAKNYHFGWKDGAPTYSLVRGVSESSHADAVAHRVGVDKEGIKGILKRRFGEESPRAA